MLVALADCFCIGVDFVCIGRFSIVAKFVIGMDGIQFYSVLCHFSTNFNHITYMEGIIGTLPYNLIS